MRLPQPIIVRLPGFLLGHLAALEEPEPFLLRLGFSLLPRLVELPDELPLPLVVVVRVRILDLGELVALDFPADLAEEFGHGRTVGHVAVHMLGDINVLEAFDAFYLS